MSPIPLGIIREQCLRFMWELYHAEETQWDQEYVLRFLISGYIV